MFYFCIQLFCICKLFCICIVELQSNIYVFVETVSTLHQLRYIFWRLYLFLKRRGIYNSNWYDWKDKFCSDLVKYEKMTNVKKRNLHYRAENWNMVKKLRNKQLLTFCFFRILGITYQAKPYREVQFFLKRSSKKMFLMLTLCVTLYITKNFSIYT